MQRIAVFYFAVVLGIAGTAVRAQTMDYPTDEAPMASTPRNAVYFTGQLGAATAIISAPDDYMADDPSPRFTGGFDVGVNIYFSETTAFNLGFGVLGKGYRVSDSVYGYDIDGKLLFTNMEIPVGVLFDLSGFRIGLDLVPSFVLTGKIKAEAAGETIEEDITEWDGVRRFNLCPRVSLGFATPGKIAFIGGIYWEIDLLDVNTEEDTDELSYRHMNIMAALGVKVGTN